MDNTRMSTKDDLAQSAERSSSLSSIGLNQFRLNPFRVLRIPVATASKQAVWQTEKILSLARLNLPFQETDPLPWLPGNSEMEIKQAVQIMEEPLQRVVEQLLWFDFEIDPQGRLLYEGLTTIDSQKLRDFLQIRELELNFESLSDLMEEKDGDSKLPEIFAHCINQANLRLLVALSVFHNIGPQMIDKAVPTSDKNDKPLKLSWEKESNFSFVMNPHDLLGNAEDNILKISYWQELWVDAMNSWYEILTNPHFSSYLRYLFKELGDEFLDEVVIETISHAIPTRLVDILVGEIKSSLYKGENERISVLVDITAKTWFDKQVWNASFNALHYFFQSELSELDCLIENEDAVTPEDIRNYFKRVEMVKQKWERIDPQNVLGLLKLFDDAVLKGVHVVTSLNLYNYPLRTVESLLDNAIEIAHSNSMWEQINGYRSQYAICQFCGKHKSEPNFPVVIKGRKVERGILNDIHYSIRPAVVPRCRNCAAFHKFIEDNSLWIGVIFFFVCILPFGGIIGILSVIVEILKEASLPSSFGLPLVMLVLCIFAAPVKVILKRILTVNLVPLDQKSIYTIKETKACKELFAEGYELEYVDSSKDAFRKALEEEKTRKNLPDEIEGN